MSVQVKGSGTIGGLDEGLVVSGIVTSSTQINVGSNIKLGNAGVITATSFVGDGSGLTGAGPSLTGSTNNTIVTVTGANAIQGEAGLTYDGSQLIVRGSDTVTSSGGTKTVALRGGDANNEKVNLSFETGAGGPIAVISGIADATGVYPNTTGSLTFNTQVAGGVFERLKIDSTGRMTQNGTTSADTASALTLKNGQSGNDHTILELISDPNQLSMIYFGASDDRYQGQIRYKDNDHYMSFYTDQAEKLRIKSDGNIAITNGDLIFASGHGIDFSATSDATHTGASGANPTTDSEKLTDYEHGTWTPRLRAYDHTGGAGWGTMKYTDGTDVIGSGRYVRIGNYVWAGFKFESGSKVFDSNWTYWSIDNTPYGANHYDKASGSLYVSQTNFFTNSNGMIGGFVHGNESYMVVNKPDGHLNATINTSNNNRYCYGHIAIYTSRT